jgi:hypothetical protein
MKIIYNPYYTERPYLGKMNLFNQVVVSTRGLLAELELRAGLTAVYPTSTERVVAYIDAIQMAILNKGNNQLFFEDSFELDKYGTAKILLDWRDKLIYAGWNGNIKGSDKLDGLASIEQYFDAVGEPDRWQRLIKHVQENRILTQNDSIEVTTSFEHLDATLKTLLSAIENAGILVSYYDRANESQVDYRVFHHHCYTDIEAHTWILQQDINDNDVVVGFDNSILSDIAYMMNRPSVASNEVGVSQQMQMLSLGLALFKLPINAQCLLDYLQLPQSPLRSIYHECVTNDGSKTYLKSLAGELKEVLLSGGLGEKWKEVINKQPILDYNHKSVERNRQKLLTFINMWEKARIDKNGNCVVNQADVKTFVSHLRNWAAQRQNQQGTIDVQFVALVAACDEMTKLLETQPEIIRVDDLIQWSHQIVQPIVLSSNVAKIGCPYAVASPTDIYANPDKLYWLCSTNDTTVDIYDFLGIKDRKILEEANVKLPDKGSDSIFLQEEIFTNLKKAKEIHLISCDIRHGEATVQNGVALQLLRNGAESAETTLSVEKKDVVGLEQPQETYIINRNIIQDVLKAHGGHLRERESYNSLNALIQTPFEYVLHYILNLHNYQSEALSDVNTVKGNVAHRYIEWLINENDKNIKKMQNMHQNDFDININHIIESHGILLLQENNQLDMKLFKSQLKKSVKVLLEIIDSNQLTIVGSEYPVETDIDGIGRMYAQVDLLLQKDEKLIVLDFKWNEGSTYTKKLEKNLALQLVVYKNILEKACNQDVVFCGYYILPKHKLLTHDSGILSDKNIEIVKPANNNDIFQQAILSYDYRKNQLLEGVIEEAEKLPLANLQYTQDSISKNLYPLDTDYNNSNIKSTPYGEPNKVLKGRLL